MKPPFTHYPRSWAPWFKADATVDLAGLAEIEARQRAEQIARDVLRTTLAAERQAAWWRLVEASGWKGGVPMSQSVPADQRAQFQRFWNALGALPHVTEGAQ